MQRTVRGFGLLFSVLALAAIPVSAQDGVAGTWTVSISSPDVGTMESEFVFEQDGTEVFWDGGTSNARGRG